MSQLRQRSFEQTQLTVVIGVWQAHQLPILRGSYAQIQALIWAAIDYFFGHRRGKLGRLHNNQLFGTTSWLKIQGGSHCYAILPQVYSQPSYLLS